MNHPALSPRYPQIEPRPTLRERFQKVKTRIGLIYEAFMHLFGLIIEFPLFLLKYIFGIDVINAIFPQGSILCSICTCAAFLGVTSSVGVAVGVGLGVGLNCAETQYYPSPNTTNFTSNSSRF